MRPMISPLPRSILRITLPFLTAALAIGIFIADTVTDLEIAVAVFYVAVVLISVSFCRTRGVVFISIGCIALTILSYFLSQTGSSHSGLTNLLISLTAIGTTAYLALKMVSAEVTAHEARAHLLHIARVTTLGELTASIAHEVNQPLTAVVTSGNACLRFLAAQPPNLEKASQAVERVVREGKRASDVIGRIRGLLKKSSAHGKKLNINELIQDVIALARGDIEHNNVTIRTELASDLPSVYGDGIQLQQVVLNLILNAVEAMRQVGEGGRQLLVSTTKENSNAVVVAIRDTGIGLPQEQFDNVFEAFYTTKQEGMGMGLTISRSIIEAHGGRLWASSNLPSGAVFQFTLPAAGERPPVS